MHEETCITDFNGIDTFYRRTCITHFHHSVFREAGELQKLTGALMTFVLRQCLGSQFPCGYDGSAVFGKRAAS